MNSYNKKLLVEIYLKGEGVEKDEAKAVEWTKKADELKARRAEKMAQPAQS